MNIGGGVGGRLPLVGELLHDTVMAPSDFISGDSGVGRLVIFLQHC